LIAKNEVHEVYFSVQLASIHGDLNKKVALKNARGMMLLNLMKLIDISNRIFLILLSSATSVLVILMELIRRPLNI
jgi:hypothetical protein